jgi:molybdopterin-binding protein
MELLNVRAAAKELGISYPTLKQWIYREKIKSVPTPGGHHRIPRSEIDRLLFQDVEKPARGAAIKTSAGLEHIISGRNQLVGRIVSLKIMGLLAKVVIDVGGQTVTSIITSDACRDLGLKVGETAAALIKATEVMVIRPTRPQSCWDASRDGSSAKPRALPQQRAARGKKGQHGED